MVVYVSAKEASLCVPHGSSVAPTASVAFAGERIAVMAVARPNVGLGFFARLR